MKKLFRVKMWKDFYDEQRRVAVYFWKWEMARYKIDAVTGMISRLEKGQK